MISNKKIIRMNDYEKINYARKLLDPEKYHLGVSIKQKDGKTEVLAWGLYCRFMLAEEYYSEKNTPILSSYDGNDLKELIYFAETTKKYNLKSTCIDIFTASMVCVVMLTIVRMLFKDLDPTYASYILGLSIGGLVINLYWFLRLNPQVNQNQFADLAYNIKVNSNQTNEDKKEDDKILEYADLSDPKIKKQIAEESKRICEKLLIKSMDCVDLDKHKIDDFFTVKNVVCVDGQEPIVRDSSYEEFINDDSALDTSIYFANKISKDPKSEAQKIFESIENQKEELIKETEKAEKKTTKKTPPKKSEATKKLEKLVEDCGGDVMTVKRKKGRPKKEDKCED